MFFFFFFFFSSRRRHTRFDCDWSSDVCSSDLSIGSLLSALAPTFETLLAARIIAGLGLGGELPVVATLVSELSPRAQRGRMIVLLESYWAYGTILAGIVAITVVANYGWRLGFAAGALPALYVAYLRRAL